MSNHQQVVDDIRLFLESDDRQISDELAQLAVQYNAYTREINQRLHRCGELLRKDLRSEAIMLCEGPPNLLQLANLLDFAEFADWEEVTIMYELTRPTPVLREIIRSLEEAYAEQQPLEEHLARHRLMALAMAPLPDRIKVLQTLREQDPTTLHWEDDLKEYEQERHREIEGEFKEAAAKGNLKKISALMEEVQSDSWLVFPPTELLEEIKRVGAQTVRKSAVKELERLEPTINEAYRAQDLFRLQPLVEEWEDIVAKSRFKSSNPLAQKVQPAINWMRDQEFQMQNAANFSAALTDLQSTVEYSSDLGELKEKYDAALAFGQPLPADINDAYLAKVAGINKAAGNKRLFLVAGTIAAVLAFAGIMYFIVIGQTRDRQLNEFLAQTRELISKESFSEAIDLLNSKPAFGSLPQVGSLRDEIRNKQKLDADRISRRALAITDARNAELLESAVKFMEAAKGDSKTLEERNEMAMIETEIRGRFRKQNAEMEVEFRATLTDAESQLKRLKTARIPWSTQDDALYTRVAAEVDGLIKKGRVLPQSLQALGKDAEKLKQDLDKVYTLNSQSRDQQRKLDELTSMASFRLHDADAQQNANGYSRIITEFTNKWPEHPWSADFRGVEQEMTGVDALVEWQGLVAQWSSVTPKTVDIAKQRLDQVKAFRAKHKGSAIDPNAQQCEEYLAAIANRGTTSDALRALFSDKLIRGVHMLEAKDGRRYYMATKNNFADKFFASVTYFVGHRGETKMGKILKKEELLTQNESQESPQSILAETILAQISTLSVTEWESFWLSTAERIRAHAELDPVLQFTLLKRVLELAGEGSVPFQKMTAATLAKLNTRDVDITTRWMDPENESAEQVRERAKRIMGDMGDLTGLRDSVRSFESKLQSQLTEKIALLGWLSETSAGKWVCRVSSSPAQTFSLKVITTSADGRGTWQTVGTAAPGQSNNVDGHSVFELDTPLQRSSLKHGRPVFGFPKGDESRGTSAPTL